MTAQHKPRRARKAVASKRPGPASFYIEELTRVKDNGNVGELYELATFDTRVGATHALHRIRCGRRPIPKGRWEFMVERGTDDTSRLLVRYLGRGNAITWVRYGTVAKARVEVVDGMLVGRGSR